MKTFKSLSEFKRVLHVGASVNNIFHHAILGRGEDGKAIYGELDRGSRPVSIVQTNAFALKTEKSDGSIADSWCYFPKASNCEVVNNNTLIIYETDRDGNKFKLLSYSIND